MAARRPTQAQIRERRSRIAAVVLGVLFLGVAVIQGPKLLKMFKGDSSSSAPPASTTTTTTPGAAGSVTPGAVAVAAPALGQLHGFSLFNPRVPFKPIPKPSTTPAPAAGAAAKPAATNASTTTQAAPGPATPPVTKAPPAAPPAATTTTPAAPPVTFTVPNGVPAALVTVNGKKQLFGTGATFPQDSPLFKLAAIAKTGLKISVLGGTFVDGQRYLVLRQGNKVTLQNQSDGSEFVIVFVKKTFADATQLTSPTQTAAAATTTPAAAAPAPPAATAQPAATAPTG